MHTVRNRLAQNPRSGGHPPSQRTSREDAAFMLRNDTPPQTFPSDLIVPPHRGSMITAAAWPEVPADEAARVARPKPAARPVGRKAARKAERRAAAQARAQQASKAAVTPETSVALTVAPVEPVAETLVPLTLSPAPEARLNTLAAVEVLPPSPTAPLPTGRALVARRQGFVDILAFVLRDSGRRLSRWSSAKRRADEMKEKLARAENRMRAMEAQLVALQEIQQRVRSANP